MIWLIILLLIVGCVLGFDVLLWMILGFVVVIGIYFISTDDKRKKEIEEKKRKLEEQKELLEKQKLDKIDKYNQEKEALVAKYGNPDKCISIEEYDLNKEIVVFGKVKRVFLLGEDLSFCSILGCTFSDNPQVKKGEVKYSSATKTNNANMIGRAVVGGTTAAKDTVTVVTHANDTVIHDYTVVINVNSFSNPVVRIPLGKDGAKVNEIVGLMNVVINANNRS